VRKHGHPSTYLDLVSVGPDRPHRHPDPHVSRSTPGRDAFSVLATQDDSGAIKVAFDYRSA